MARHIRKTNLQVRQLLQDQGIVAIDLLSRIEALHLPLESISIDALHLSARSHNALKRSGVDNARKLIYSKDSDLARIRNVGVKSIQEIVKNTGDYFERITKPEESDLLSVENAGEKTTEESDSRLIEYLSSPSLTARDQSERNDAKGPPPANGALDKIPVGVLGLSIRARHGLGLAKIETVGQLVGCSPTDLLSIGNIGQKTVDEIISKRDAYLLSPLPTRYTEPAITPARNDRDSKGRDTSLRSGTGVARRENAGNEAILRLSRFESIPLQIASDSILRQTIPGLFGLDTEAFDLTLRIASDRSLASLELPDQEWTKLACAGIVEEDTFHTLYTLSLAHIFGSGTSNLTVDTIKRTFKDLCEECRVETSTFSPSPSEIIPYAEALKIAEYRIDSFDIPRDLTYECAKAGFVLWRDLIGKTEKGIIDCSGVSGDSLKLIYLLWQCKPHLNQAICTSARWLTSSSLEDLVYQFLSSGSTSEREKKIVLGRLGLLRSDLLEGDIIPELAKDCIGVPSKRLTLEELGQILGVTRERIRQIESRCLRMLRHHTRISKLGLFKLAVTEVLRSSGGACFLSELLRPVSQKLGWTKEGSEPSFSSFLKLFGGIEIDGENLVKDSRHSCLNCESALRAFKESVGDQRRELQLSEAIDHLVAECKSTACPAYENGLLFSEGFIYLLTQKTNDIFTDEGVVYSRHTGGSKRGSNSQVVERILREAGRPMHFTEIYQEAKRLLPDWDTTERNIYALIERNDSLLLWDRGTYVHCDCVSIDTTVIREIETWLIHKLTSGLPVVHVAAAFETFESACEDAKITSESALYSCLRRFASNQLSYPRYPQVYLSATFEFLESPPIVLEEFILDSGGEVSYDDMRNYAHELGLKDFQFQQSISKLSNVVRTKRRGFAHISSIKVDFDKLSVLLDYVEELLHNVDQLSVVKVFKDKGVTCAMIGIDSPQLLYSLMRLVRPDALDVANFPMIRLRSAGTTGVKGMVAELAEYVRRKMAPCSMDELETRFVQGLGYSDKTLYSVTRANGMLRYGRGCLVHMDALDWTDAKQTQLEFQAHTLANRWRAAGRPYALLTELTEDSVLPVLGNGISWTLMLLAEMLGRRQQFRVLGSKRNAFVQVPNEYSIETLEDLIHFILRTDHEGAADLGKFEEYIRQAEIIQKRITAEMLGNQQKVKIDNSVIMIRPS